MKSLYERILNLRNRISLDGDDTIYEEDYLLLDEVLDLIENISGEDTDIETQIYDYNNTVDIYKELEIGVKLKKQKKLLELYRNREINRNLPHPSHADELIYTREIEKLESELNDQNN